MSVTTRGIMRLGDVRARAALALAPEDETDPNVYAANVQPDFVDAVTPPALLLFWADPWMAQRTVGGMGGGQGYADAWLEILAVVARIDVEPTLDSLESLVAYVLERFRADDDTWPIETFYAPRGISIGGVPYIGARMVFKVPITV